MSRSKIIRKKSTSIKLSLDVIKAIKVIHLSRMYDKKL